MNLKRDYSQRIWGDHDWDHKYCPGPIRFPLDIQKEKDIFFDEENALNTYFMTRMVCRLGKLRNRKKYTILSPIPARGDRHTDMDFGDCSDESALECIRKADNRDVNVLWSGGIDSTVVFWALQKTGHPFNLHFDPIAETEHPFLWDLLHKNKFPQVTLCNNYGMGLMEDYAHDPDHYFVMGEPGDNIHGAGRSFIFSKEQRNAPYHENVPLYIDEMLFPSVMEVLNKSDANLKQWHWAMSYTCKYQYCMLRSIRNFHLYCYDRPGIPANLHLFYDTPNFNRWSITNQTENSAWQEHREYKMSAKDYCLANGDSQDYRDNKLKVPSSNRERLTMFTKPCSGMVADEDWMLVIKRTFGSSAPDIEYGGRSLRNEEVSRLP